MIYWFHLDADDILIYLWSCLIDDDAVDILNAAVFDINISNEAE